MNLSLLHKMIRNIDLSIEAMRYCINCRGECEFLDYKRQIDFSSNHSLADITKDVIAMKNTGGGYIVIGVEDKTWAPLGIKQTSGIDTKILRDKLRSTSGLDLEVEIVEHDLMLPNGQQKFGLILVRGQKNNKSRYLPVMPKKNFFHQEKYGFRQGDIFFRDGDSTKKIVSNEELGKLIDDMQMQLEQDERLLNSEQPSFAIEDITYFLLEKGYDRFIGREELKKNLLHSILKDPRLWIINIHGPGGVGKSTLANCIAYEVYEQKLFEAVLQLTAKDTRLTESGIKKCGRTLYSLENLLENILSLFWGEIPSSLEEQKEIAALVLSEYKMLLILDNMETVDDSRILQFVQSLPVENKSKIVLTSRTQSGGWELPFPVHQLSHNELEEFIRIRSMELDITFPQDQATLANVKKATGGLPLAVQWVLGSYKQHADLKQILDAATHSDSPVLEFSFGNIWKLLATDAKTILAVMSIFDEPPTMQQISIALDFSQERIEKALEDLMKVTLVTKVQQENTGRQTYLALPITLSFSKNKLNEMEGLEITCRKRFNKFTHEMALNEADIQTYQVRFAKYGISSDNEKKATLLCQKGESAMFSGNIENAENHFREARDLAPNSAYVYAMTASFELGRNRIGQAMEKIETALKFKTKKTSSLCYAIKARIHQAQRDYKNQIVSLHHAVESSPEDHYIRHQYGVALSKNRQTKEAIEQFTIIIEQENAKEYPTTALMYALKTRLINLQRLGKTDDFNRDKQHVERLIREFPHLGEYAPTFAEFAS